ncbi:hypothetical protein [Burkholderia sp. LMU1-1-1.1]|uniref:hypothetical protein n=1 Tax=Burkholderia sp. LMU1-1-1.1 TaxID=3135266 RepID=UPI0034475899
MTRFSPPIIHQCPACAGYFKRYALISLFFDTVTEWSDGKSGQWWANASGSVGRCPVCTGIVWLADADEIMRAPHRPRPIGPMSRAWHRLTGDRGGCLRDERVWDSLPAGIRNAEQIDGLKCADDFIEALAALPSDVADREKHLRQRLWWASNDHLRVTASEASAMRQPAVAEEIARANAQRLVELLEHDPKEQVARGELLRQLGRFDEAVAVLAAVVPDGYSEVKASKIDRLARQRTTLLQPI